jgi:hypothetical protein
MSTIEIQRHEWEEFFANFTTFHRGWTVKMDVFSLDIGAQRGTGEIPFEGIVADLRGGGRDSIEVVLGENVESHLTHTIEAPTHVRLESLDMTRAHNEVIQIESASGTTVLLSFYRSMPLAKTSHGTFQRL